MYVSVTTARTGDEPIENATIVAEEMTRWLRDIDGFEGFLMLSQPGRSLGLTFWESRDVAERHHAARMGFIARMTEIAGVEVEQVDGFELTYAQLGERVAALSR